METANVQHGPQLIAVDTGDAVFWSSSGGRHFPGKSWDEDYHRLLGRSQFVLCPKGDYIWTYRFFEAALCGAIPVIEVPCAAYEGFRYRTFNDRIDDLEWREDEARHNYYQCQEILTVPTHQLNAEIQAALAAASRLTDK